MKTEACLESLVCPVCRSKIGADPARCSRCGLAHHDECSGICARYGCGGRVGEEPKPLPVPVPDPLPVPVVQEDEVTRPASSTRDIQRWERRLGLWVASILMAIFCVGGICVLPPEARPVLGGFLMAALMAGVTCWALTRIPTHYD